MTMRPACDDIRSLRNDDVTALLALLAEHVKFERSPLNIDDYQEAIIEALLSPAHSATCIVAVKEGEPVGYATTSPEFSTWQGHHYLHMDTLFVTEEFRGGGIGATLFAEILTDAGRRGFDEVQWQTPDWNTEAIRFYERHQATAQPKIRFSRPVI